MSTYINATKCRIAIYPTPGTTTMNTQPGRKLVIRRNLTGTPHYVAFSPDLSSGGIGMPDPGDGIGLMAVHQKTACLFGMAVPEKDKSGTGNGRKSWREIAGMACILSETAGSGILASSSWQAST